ncbi:MAG: hypothetical protein ACOYL7_15190 [Caldilinea sp.]|jgi:hypothetical protein
MFAHNKAWEDKMNDYNDGTGYSPLFYVMLVLGIIGVLGLLTVGAGLGG